MASKILLRARQARRALNDLRSYFDLDRHGNEVVRRADFARCPRPVLLIYGFFATRRSFEVIERRLRRDGHCVFSINLGGAFDAFNTLGIDQSAEKVAEKIERMYARHPSMGPLSIIGHSKGGLIGRYYVKRLGGEKRVSTLITLAAPHNGTPTAYFGLATLGLVARSLWQMTPMSPFIRRLKQGPFPPSVHFVSVYSKADRLTPFPCAMLETEGHSNLKNVEIEGVSHHEFLTRKKVYDVIAAELDAGWRRSGLSLVDSSEG